VLFLVQPVLHACMKRILHIDDVLHTISNKKMNSLLNLGEIKEIILPCRPVLPESFAGKRDVASVPSH